MEPNAWGWCPTLLDLGRMTGMKRVSVALVVAALLASCSFVDVENALQITEVQTGWYDAGILGGRNKLVPSISLQLENVSGSAVSSIQLNAVFHRVIDVEEPPLGDHFIQAVDRDGLDARATGDLLVLRSGFGYTGTQARLEMLQNRSFVDARVEIYGKSGSRAWTLMGEFPIERRLLTE
jgi:hypothetical protein